jgi:hypothetical protein
MKEFVRKAKLITQKFSCLLPGRSLDKNVPALVTDYSKVFDTMDSEVIKSSKDAFEKENKEFQRLISHSVQMQTILENTRSIFAVRYCYLFHAQTPGWLKRN